jgi:DNA helicase II / ATP-dependent DNA helicase PcrA
MFLFIKYLQGMIDKNYMIHNKKLFEKQPDLLKGNIQIIACAGSGKTEFVSERIAFQLYYKIAKPEEIVAFTFTDKAAEELKFRVRSKIKELIGKQPDIGDMYIGTIHAFAFRLLQEYVPKYRAFDMLDEVSRMAFALSIRTDLVFEHLCNSLENNFQKPFGYNKQNWVLRTFLKDIDLYREESLSTNSIRHESFQHALEIYITKLEEKQFLDFSAILKISVDTLCQSKEVLEQVRNQYKFFTVDEYQDVNPIQEKLIQLISNQENVCVVGDDDQSIYQWRGADVQNIITFQKRYKNVKVYHLDTNRRSHDKIVKTADEFIQKNAGNRLKKDIKDKGVLSENGDLYKIVFPKQEEEIQWILSRIKSLVGTEFSEGGNIRKIKYSDISLLFRSIKIEAKPYIDAFKKNGIPILYSGVGGLLETLEVESMMNIFKYICDFEEGYTDDTISEIYKKMDKRLKQKKEADLKKKITKLKSELKSGSRISLQNLYLNILNLLGLSNIENHKPENEVLLYNLGRFSSAIADYESTREYTTVNSIKNFIWFMMLHADSSYDSGITDGLSGLVDAVSIMTMHGTKGLGFPIVFMPGHLRKKHEPNFGPTFLDINTFDYKRFLNHDTDERRLYYVAMTRAKKYLFITSPDIKVDGKRKSPRSWLFDEISSKHFITESKPDPTKRKPCFKEGGTMDILFPTSYSELAYYLNCGYDYKLRFIYGFSPMLVSALGFGKQVHNIINLLHKKYESNKQIPDASVVHSLLDSHFYLRYASDDVEQRLKEGAKKSILRYIDLWKSDFSLAVKTERRFEMEFFNTLIVGSIDMLKRDSQNQSVLEVIDFKTGKPSNDIMHKYELQVQLYTIAAQEALGIHTKNAYIHFLDSQKNERLIVQTETKALETAKEELKIATDGITKASFLRDSRTDSICKSCDWADICPKRDRFRR